MLTCLAEPQPPAAETDLVAVGEYLADLQQAGQSCRDTVGDYRTWAAGLPKDGE